MCPSTLPSFLDLPAGIRAQIHQLVFTQVHLSSCTSIIEGSKNSSKSCCLLIFGSDYRSDVHGWLRASRWLRKEAQRHCRSAHIRLTCDLRELRQWEDARRESAWQYLFDRVHDLSLTTNIGDFAETPAPNLLWWRSLKHIRYTCRVTLTPYAHEQKIQVANIQRLRDWQAIAEWRFFNDVKPSKWGLGLHNKMDRLMPSLLSDDSIPTTLHEDIEQHPNIEGLFRYRRYAGQDWSHVEKSDPFCLFVSPTALHCSNH